MQRYTEIDCRIDILIRNSKKNLPEMAVKVFPRVYIVEKHRFVEKTPSLKQREGEGGGE